MLERIKKIWILCFALLIIGDVESAEGAERQDKVNLRIDINPTANNNNNNERSQGEVIDREPRLASDEIGAKDNEDIASKAAQEAKAASDAQNIAGKQASHQVKVQLAEKAFRAAKAAEAELIGKVAMVEQLAEEIKETQNVEREGSLSLQRAQENLNAATRAAKDSRQQVETLKRAVETAKSNLGNARIAAEGSRRSLNEKEQLLIAAKKRVEELKNRLQKAKGELAKTNQAAVKATASAREARLKVNHDTPRT